MSYKISYRNQPDLRVPCLDAIQFMGFRRSRHVYRAAKTPNMTKDVFALICSFAGVKGYPVEQLWKRWRAER